MPTPSKRKRPGIYLSVILLLLFLLLVGSAGLFFSNRASSTTPALPTAIHWQEVLPQNTLVTSLVMAPNNPAILYACALSPLPTLLRSTDAGVHWQSLKFSFGQNDPGCSIAVNPTQANDLYISTLDSVSPLSGTLKHSSDGGQTWTTMRPIITLPNGQHFPWAGGNITFADHLLFARLGLNNIISSSDEGQTWKVIDEQITQKLHKQPVACVVDPTNPRIIYELVGMLGTGTFAYITPGTPVPTPAPTPSASQLMRQLYKTTDGGASWHEVLSAVPYGFSLQMAPDHPNLLYLGGKTSFPARPFSMQWSGDGGSSWQTIAMPANTSLLNRWFLGPSGLLYGISNPQSETHSGNRQIQNIAIQRYDPSTHQWSAIAIPSSSHEFGSLIAVASSPSHKEDVLWATNLFGALYRGTF